MNLSYDSILGVPTVNLSPPSGKQTTTNNNSSMSHMLNPVLIISLIVIVLLYYALFSNLGKSEGIETSNQSLKFLSVLFVGVFLIVVVLNGLQYFFNINLDARLKNLFSTTPELDIKVTSKTDDSKIAPVPEIKIKKQVFHIPGNKYNYENAQALCEAYDAELATYDQIETAYKNGGEWCSYGWSADQMALFPTQKQTWSYLQGVEGHENDCGRPGINGGFMANKQLKFGVNCYGYKPKMNQQDKDSMDNTPLYPESAKDIAHDKRVSYWRNKVPSILVSPFNKNIWSLV